MTLNVNVSRAAVDINVTMAENIVWQMCLVSHKLSVANQHFLLFSLGVMSTALTNIPLVAFATSISFALDV